MAHSESSGKKSSQKGGAKDGNIAGKSVKTPRTRRPSPKKHSSK